MVSYLKAKLTSWKRINIVLFTDMPRPEKLSISLFKEEKLIKKIVSSHFTSINNLYVTDILLDEDYELGNWAEVALECPESINIDPVETGVGVTCSALWMIAVVAACVIFAHKKYLPH